MLDLAKTRVVGGADSFGRYTWQCECGAKSAASWTDRDEAREALKAHRREVHGKQPKLTLVEGTPVASATKKTPSKKTAKAPRARKGGVSPEQAKAALAKLEAGKTTLLAESKHLGYSHNGPLRAALRELLGAEKYAKLMEGKRGRAKGTKNPPKPKTAKKPKAKAAKKAAPAAAPETPTP